MKKILALVLALLMVLGTVATLSACNGGKTPQETTIGTDKITTEATDKQTTEATEPKTTETTEPKTTETTEPTTPDTTEPTTPDTTEPTTPDTTEPTTPDTTEPTTPDTTEPVTPDTTEPTTPDTTEPTTPDTTEPTTPDTTEPTTPDTTEPTTPDTTEPTTPDTTEPTTPDTTEPTTPDTTEPTTPDTTEPTTPDTTEPTTPDTTEPTTPDTTEPTTPDTTEPDYELTIEEAIALGKSMTNNKYTSIKYYVTGTVTKIVATKNVTITDGNGNEITIANAYNADGTLKLSEMDEKPAVGDVVTVYGVIGQSNGSPRIKDGWIISFEAPDTSTDEPITDGPSTDESVTDTPQKPNYPALYGDGEAVNDAGIDWESGFFANINHSIDKSIAVSITAEELLAKMQDRDGNTALKKGEVWIVTEPLELKSSTKYYGNGAAIIAEGGIIIKDAVDVVLKDVLIDGSITIEGSQEVIFFKVYVNSDSTAVTIKNSSDQASKASSDISFKTCRFRGNDAAVSGTADCVTIYSCYAYAHNGITLSGDDNIIQNCKIFASDTAVSIEGNDCVIRENRIEVYALGTGISVQGSTNALVALNDIRGVQKSITVQNCFNSSVILNRTILITGENNTNLYVIDNNVSGYMTLKDNNYLIADGNKYPFDGLVHSINVSGNENVNGDNVTNVNYRPEVGANEDILPHTNKDLFVAMPRKASVSDASFTSATNLNAYVKDCSQNSSVVIVPPGAYSAYGAFRVDSNHNNTKIYAYGVYNEYSETDPHAYTTGQVVFANAKNVSLYGLTLGYVLPSSGQVRIVEKFFTIAGDDTKYYSEDELAEADKNKTRTYKFTIIPDAGFLDGFTTSDPSIFHTWWPEFFLSDENGEQKMYCEENLKSNHSVEKNYDENGEYDGTLTLTVKLPATTVDDYREAKSASGFFDRVSVGNVITCRFSFGGNGSYTINGCDNIEFKDTVIYGYAGVLSVVAGNNAGITFERHHNAVHSENVIDKDTYEKYVALEEKWSVDFEIREQTLEDGTVIYRGPKSRSGSIDAFHIASNRQGVTVTSALLESMVDDGSNQKGSSSRLHSIVNNGDGTTTICYKALVSSVAWGNVYGQTGSTVGTMACTNFVTGNRIYIYTPEGRTVCDTTVISDAVKGEELTYDLKDNATHQIIKRFCYYVKVNTADIDWDAILDKNGNIKYDLSDNSHRLTNRLVVDNLSFNSCDYTMDNVMVFNGHSRGFLIKSRNVTIKHCTFRNVCNSGLRIMVEPEWGESSVAMNITVQQCLFDNVGFHMQKYDDYSMANILIEGPSTEVGEHTVIMDNIRIIGNKFTNNKQRYAIYVNSAKNVVIKNNTFDDLEYEITDKTGLAVVLRTCMNVEISDNTYNYDHYDPDNIRSVISGYNFANIYGTDVTNKDGTPKLPDNITTK